MPEPRIIGTCDTCKKQFGVPARGKEYRCKACGGVVRAPASKSALQTPIAAPIAEEAESQCEHCSASNPPSARFCEECGEPLTSESRAERGSQRTQARGEATVALQRARKAIGIARMVFGFNAIVSGLQLLFLYKGALRISFAEDLRPFWFAAALLTGMLAFSVVGFLRVTLEPFLWAVLLASLSTLAAVGGIAVGDPSPFSITWALALWALVPATISVRRYLAEYPDSYAAQALQGTNQEARSLKRSKGSIGKREGEDLARIARKRLALRTLAAVAIIIGGSAAFAGWTLARTAPSPQSILKSFVKEWNAGDTEALSKRFALAKNRSARNWTYLQAGPLANQLPFLGEANAGEFNSRSGQQEWETKHGKVLVEVDWHKGQWVIREFRAPTPSIDQPLTDFRSAWNGSRLEGLSGLFRAKSAEEMHRSLPKIFTKRGWMDESGNLQLPRIGEPSLDQDRGYRRDYRFDHQDGTTEASFEIGEQGHWILKKLKP